MGFYVTPPSYTNLSCDECGTSIFQEVEPSRSPQPINGLTLDVGTGYGMYWDCIQGTPKFILCMQCSANFARALPNLAKTITNYQ